MKFKFLVFLLLIPQLGFSYYLCRPCCSRLQLPGWWGSADYLLLWRKARFYPLLVTTNPTLIPTLDAPGTTVLFGNENIHGSPKSGGRGDIGFWLTRCLGFGGGAFAVGEENKSFDLKGDSAGLPIFGRPFFNTNAGVEDVDLLSFPALQLNGSVDISTHNRIWGLDLYARYRFFRTPCFKFDLLAGFEFNKIIDNLEINSLTTSALLETEAVMDHFGCENLFYGGLAGLTAEWRSKNWAIRVLGKVGIGNMHKEIDIFGSSSSITLGGPAIFNDFGLLAQPSNSGHFTINKFEVIPQINANIQLRVWGHMWLSAGYTFMYWHSLALAGEQVDLNINPTQVPGPPIGLVSPIFSDAETSYWIQGFTAGIYVCY